MAIYKTRTYIAGDWDNDKDAVDQCTNGMIAIIGVFRLLMRTI
jgi:hypothetical protein